jgi:hypothetical protein
MRSIGELAVGQAGYYLDQAQTMVSRARAVSSGVEDYYLGGPEAPGTWTGNGARLGLDGRVNAARLDRVLAGEHPGSSAAAHPRFRPGAFPRRRGTIHLTRRTLTPAEDIVGELRSFGAVSDRRQTVRRSEADL